MQNISFIDSHTGGEPTRLVLSGGPALDAGSLGAKVRQLSARHDRFRSAVVTEPRGNDVLVGALLTEPESPGASFGVIFFNNVGYLGMCGHGLIGVVTCLAHQSKISPGPLQIDTPVGLVTARLAEDGQVSVTNVMSFRLHSGICVSVPELGEICGDVAWGGNWFFLARDTREPIELGNLERLTSVSWAIRQALKRQGISGAGGQEIDHIELFGAPKHPDADSKNFVLCPGKAYDRSPCGTGTSAKLACLAADGDLEEGETWVQESIVGSLFRGTYRFCKGGIEPTISGSAHVMAEGNLLLDPRDPFEWGIPAHNAPAATSQGRPPAS